jgi:Domain of unknown function (DUF6259)
MRVHHHLLLPVFLVALAEGALGLCESAQPVEGTAAVIILENAAYRIELDRQHGRLLRLQDRKGNIDLVSSLDLAENFRLRVPVAEDPRNLVHGKDQRLTGVKRSENELTLLWDGPMQDTRGVAHAISTKMGIRFQGESVVIDFSLSNDSKEKIEEVWYPSLGGLLQFGPDGTRGQTTLSPPPNNKRFRTPFGQHSSGYPGQNMSFVELNNPSINRGLYIGAHDRVARYKMFYFLERGMAPKSDVAAWLVHYPFVPPGGAFEGAPVVLQFHDGDWIAAGKQIYRPWFIETFGLMKPEEDWIRQNSFFQMIMIMLPEGNVNYRIPEIPRLARDGLKYGVKSLQIAGWQYGGHDNGYPYYEPDPRLGTWKDLQKAIRQCHDLGVKIYFFANIHVNNLDTEWYETELKNYDYELITGHAAWVSGWGMGTLASRTSLTTPLMAFADISFPGMADGHAKYFRKLAEIGADGIHIDKCFPQALNFNPRIIMSPDQAPWEGTVQMTARIARECREQHPDFRMSAETSWDRLLSTGAATWWAGNMSVARKVFPELVETVGLYQPYDYIGVNDAVRNGYAVMVSPFHFNRSMDFQPWRGLASYIREVKQIRDELADYVFCGELVDSGSLARGSNSWPTAVECAVYKNLKSGKRACILTNRSRKEEAVKLADFRAFSGTARIYKPRANDQPQALPGEATVEPERIAFIAEH